MKLKKYKSVICIIAAVCLLGAAAFCGYHICHHNAQVDEQAEAFEELAEVVENAPDIVVQLSRQKSKLFIMN